MLREARRLLRPGGASCRRNGRRIFENSFRVALVGMKRRDDGRLPRTRSTSKVTKAVSEDQIRVDAQPHAYFGTGEMARVHQGEMAVKIESLRRVL